MALHPRFGHVEHPLLEIAAEGSELDDLDPLHAIDAARLAEVDATQVGHREITKGAAGADDDGDGG